MFSMYPDCPKRALARQFKGDITALGFTLNDDKVSAGASIGTITHKIIENYYKTKLDGKVLDTEKGTFDLLDDKDIEYDKTTPDRDTAIVQIKHMADEYINKVGRYIKPIATEVSLEAEIADGWKLTGMADLIAESDDGICLRDLKTGSHFRSYYGQLGAYYMLMKCGEYGKPNKIFVDFVKRALKTKPTEISIYEYNIEMCELTAWNIMQRIMDDYNKLMETKDPFSVPENTSSQLCGDKYCLAYNSDFCPSTKKGIINEQICI